ncbi:hypothetical protein GBAR_LOCUS17832, partial [Geodia barretti]
PVYTASSPPVAGRSLGLHLPSSEGGALFDCATITPFYTSDDLITVYTPESEYTTRTEFVKKVSGDNIPPNDVLIVGQRVSNGCVMTVMRTLGETQGIANGYANILDNRADTQFTQCDPDVESGGHLPFLAPLLLLIPLLSTLL